MCYLTQLRAYYSLGYTMFQALPMECACEIMMYSVVMQDELQHELSLLPCIIDHT